MRTRCNQTYATTSMDTMTKTTAPSCQATPIINILRGIMSSTVSRSSKMARIRALRNSHVALRPAAASMENSTPAEVGAAKRPASSVSFQASKELHRSAGSITYTK
jgi:hypothetical protein